MMLPTQAQHPGSKDQLLNSKAQLLHCIQLMKQGPWRFVQLRGECFDERCIDGDDVDLLGTRESVDALTHAAYDWVRARWCHLWVMARKPDKVEWSLISRDGQHVARFDLWIELSQLSRGRRSLRYEHVAQAVTQPQETIQRLPVDAEACLYVHHLVCKRKDINGQSAQQRLLHYATACAAAGHDALTGMLNRIRDDGRIGDDDEAKTFAHLTQALQSSNAGMPRSRGPAALLRKLRLSWLSSPRHAAMITVMGCDGAGKTTLAHALKDQSPVATSVYTGKHLYRKSILYKLAVIFIRPLLLRSREDFDEVVAPFAYLRASLALRLRLMFPGREKRMMFIDRSIVDFLYVKRKTDHPRFSRWSWLMNLCGRRIRTIHCVVSYEIVQARKQEMTRQGHAAYDQDMFHCFTTRVPTDYVAFNNDATVEESAAALKRVLQLAEDGA